MSSGARLRVPKAAATGRIHFAVVRAHAVIRSFKPFSAVLLALTCPAVVGLLPAGAIAQDTPAGTEAGAAPPKPEERLAVADLFTIRTQLHEFALSVGDIDTEAFLAPRRAEATELKAQLAEISSIVTDDQLASLTYDRLLDLQTDVRGEVSALKSLADSLESRARQRDTQLDKLRELRERWDKAVEVAREREAPPEVLDVIRRTSPEIDATISELREDRNAALAALSEIATLQLRATRFQNELAARQAAAVSAARVAADAPIWQPRTWSNPLGGEEGLASQRRHVRAVAAYLADHGVAVAGWFFGILVVAFAVMRSARAAVNDFLRDDAGSLKAGAVFERPFSAALLIALLSMLSLAPPFPIAFSHLVWAIVPIPAAALAVTVFARPIRLSAYTLAVILSFTQFELLNETMPAIDRILIIVQSLALIGAFLVDLRRDNWKAAFPGVRASRLAALVRLVCAVLGAVIVATILGFVGLAETMKNLAFGGLGLAMIFVVLSYVLTGFVLALLWVRPLSRLEIVRRERRKIVATLRTGIRWVAGLFWAIATLELGGLLSAATELLDRLLATEFGIGAVTVSVSAIASGVAILLVTYLVTQLVRFVIEGSARTTAAGSVGAAFAISKLVRYAIAVVGFLFAIVVIGFDLTSVTVLAGAVGVGLGFGLQNIFNNFFSGLIMLLEQPIRVNDIAKVDELMGKVREVGFRATVIETFDGAEVIVPNADFISKTVLNWTKSNRRRRAEIDVGVAYGSDTKQVLEILEASAADMDGVAGDPKSFAIFTGFGDSSLNFRLYVWVVDLSDILTVPSRIRQTILEKLDDAGITVPFPQRDVHIRVPPDAKLPPLAEAGD
jgi:small-conductance mechanosensitive channel